MNPSFMPTGLFHLPTELLLQILEGVGKDDLYSLSILSRCLHSLALPLYLSRYGISDKSNGSTDSEPRELVLHDDTMNALPGLLISFTITTLKRLEITFNGPGDVFLRDIARLTLLVSNLARVEEVVLDFIKVDLWALDESFFSTLSLNVEECVVAICRLIQVVLEKSCTYLSIRHGLVVLLQNITVKRQPMRRERRDMTSIVARSRPAFTKLFNRLMRRPFSIHHSHPCVACVHDAPHPKTQLQTFDIYSPIVIHPYFFDFVLKILKVSPITTLSLRDLGLTVTWPTFLNRIRLPTLTTLTIKSSELSLSDLTDFLTRHSTIATLNLGDGRLMTSDIILPPQTLPGVTTLIGIPEYISCFLQTGYALPSLESVTIIYRTSFGPGDPFDVDSSLTIVAPRLKTLILSLELAVMSDSADWVVAAIAYGAQPLFRHLKSLGVTASRCPFSEDAVDLLPQWLALFPALEQLSLFDFSLPEVEFDKVAQRFISSVSRSCSRIKTVNINGQEHGVRRTG